MNYITELKQLYNISVKDASGITWITEMMKISYPGNYTIQEGYIPEKYTWGVRLVFEDPQEEIMFILKNS